MRTPAVADDLSPGDWLTQWLRTFGDVRSLVPAVFEAYVRLLHPAYRQDKAGDCQPVFWSRIARAKGMVIHAEVQFESLVGQARLPEEGEPGLWDVEPSRGSLPRDLAAIVSPMLARHTDTADRCWFAVWDGWADLDEQASGAPKLQLPHRDYVLFEGSLTAAAHSFGTDPADHRSPNLWWPADRSWLVATEVDLMSTYIGASSACIAELVGCSDLELIRADPADKVTLDADRRNPPPSKP